MINREEREKHYIERLKQINPMVELRGEYITHKTPTIFYCKIHCIEWKTSPQAPLQGSGCPLCGKERASIHRRLTEEKFQEKVREANPDIIFLTHYQGGSCPITIQCGCGNIHTFSEARALLMGQRCPQCKNKRIGQSQRKTDEEFVKELKEKFPTILPLERYQGSHHKIKYRCLSCGYEHSATPTNLLTGYGCPNCCSSKGEAAIRSFLQQNKIEFEEQKWFEECRDKLPLRFDFYIPNINLLIEYQGEQHYKRRFDWTCESAEDTASFETLQKHDDIKRRFCKQCGYKELEIKYTELKNIEKILNENVLKEVISE